MEGVRYSSSPGIRKKSYMTPIAKPAALASAVRRAWLLVPISQSRHTT